MGSSGNTFPRILAFQTSVINKKLRLYIKSYILFGSVYQIRNDRFTFVLLASNHDFGVARWYFVIFKTAHIKTLLLQQMLLLVFDAWRPNGRGSRISLILHSTFAHPTRWHRRLSTDCPSIVHRLSIVSMEKQWRIDVEIMWKICK